MLNLISRGLVHSILLLIIAGLIVFYPGPPIPNGEAKVLGEKSACSGVKLNYPRVFTETINGKEFAFRYNCILKNFRAASYDGNCEGCSGRTHFTNEPVAHGICAVDPQVILPHSLFYVPGYGTCKAADRGGKVKGKKVDLGFEDVRSGWWSARTIDILTFAKQN